MLDHTMLPATLTGPLSPDNTTAYQPEVTQGACDNKQPAVPWTNKDVIDALQFWVPQQQLRRLSAVWKHYAAIDGDPNTHAFWLRTMLPLVATLVQQLQPRDKQIVSEICQFVVIRHTNTLPKNRQRAIKTLFKLLSRHIGHKSVRILVPPPMQERSFDYKFRLTLPPTTSSKHPLFQHNPNGVEVSLRIRVRSSKERLNLEPAVRRLISVLQSLADQAKTYPAAKTWLRQNIPTDLVLQLVWQRKQNDLHSVTQAIQKLLDRPRNTQRTAKQRDQWLRLCDGLGAQLGLAPDELAALRKCPRSPRSGPEGALLRLLLRPLFTKPKARAYYRNGLILRLEVPYEGTITPYFYRNASTPLKLLHEIVQWPAADRCENFVASCLARCHANLRQVLDEIKQAGLPLPDPGQIALIIRFWKNALTDLPKLRRELRQRAREKVALLAATTFSQKHPQLLEYVSGFSHARALQRRIVALLGPTNSGKTHIALDALAQSKSGIYLAPLRLMALEKRDELAQRGINASLITGEERILHPSPFSCRTVEMLDLQTPVATAVIDEVQMLLDPDRGWAWTNAICGTPAQTIYLTGPTWTLPLISKLAKVCGDELELRQLERNGQLTVEPHPRKWNTVPPGSAVVVFSRNAALTVAGMYRRLGHQVSVLYGALSPEVRREQARRFRAGETQIVVATDVIGMGLNLPASHLYFWETRKFDGQLVRPLTATEIQQIAGRAGRGLGQDGYVGAFSSRELRDVRSRLPQHAPAVPLRFNVSPSLEHVEIIGRELGTTRISPVLHFFDQHVPFTDPSFKPQRSGGMHALAALADLLAPKLAISSKFSWVCLPLNAQEPVDALAFTTWLRLFRDGQTAHLDTIDAILKQAPAEPGFRGWQDHLERIEAKLKLLVAYQCLSWRFPDTFPERDQAAALREQLAGVLTDALSTLHSHDERVACAQCHRAMSFNSEFELCRECYRNQRQNNDPEEDPDYPDWS